MPHHVYANDNEIASKSADGMSVACFPDVCISPGPPPPPGGVPVPYPNTAFAKDLTKVTKTVLIKRKGAAVENHSKFSRSTGDEPATPALKKGVVSTKIMGTCYFQSWSMDVKAEGKGVARHMDMVTHNHINTPNTGPHKYVSIFNTKNVCAKDKKRIAKKCPVNKKDNKKKKKKKKRGLLSKIGGMISKVDDLAADAYGYKRKPKNAWIDEYCDGLWVKPMSGTKRFKEFEEKIKEDLAALEKISKMSSTDIMKSAAAEILAMAKEQFGFWYVLRKAGGLGVRSVIKNVIGGAAGTTGVGLVVTGAMAAWTVADVVSTVSEIAKKLGPEGMKVLEEVLDPEKVKKKIEDTLREYKKDPQKALADAMSLKAKSSPCLRARKCQLVPYNQTEEAKTAAKGGKGCCPGQTGHHVLPDSMLKGLPCYKKAGGRNKAPVICLEGTTNTHGSHGAAHQKLYETMKEYRKVNNTNKISYEDAKKQALDAVTKPPPNAPASGCSRKCLEAQLDAFYAGCKNEQMKATSGTKKNEGDSSSTPDKDI